MKIIFWGSSEFAIPALQALYQAGFSVPLVVTQLDAPRGRYLKLAPCPVALAAKELGLQIFQPERLKENEALEKLKKTDADAYVVAAYGRLIPNEILNLPPKGTVNVHPSLLPRWRGPSPLQSAILAGDSETGVSLILLDQEIDHGSLLAQIRVPLSPAITTPELEKNLSEIGAKLLVETLPYYFAGKIKPKPQDHSQATFCKLLKKEDGKINWDEPAEVIERKIRALKPWPGTYTFYQEDGKEQSVKIHKASVVQGKLKLEIVQPANGRPMSYEDFLRGHPQEL